MNIYQKIEISVDIPLPDTAKSVIKMFMMCSQ